MKKEVEELIRILAKEEEKMELLKGTVKGELRSMVKELLEEVALVERETFCESAGEAKNGLYPRDIEGFFGAVEDIKIPRTREGGFKPFFIRPYRKASYEIDDLVIAMYQGGSSIRRSCQKVCKCQTTASTSFCLVSVFSFLSLKPDSR
jgi:transposase-like protein